MTKNSDHEESTPINPLSPPSGPATGSFNGLHAKSIFLTAREPTPLAGTSLTPILTGEELTSRPPIHLLFDDDRGLRDSDWKLVSFRSGPRELYNLANDRTELNNLAATEPERVATMAKQWHEIAQATMGKNFQPVSEQSTPKLHREWSDYSGKKQKSK